MCSACEFHVSSPDRGAAPDAEPGAARHPRRGPAGPSAPWTWRARPPAPGPPRPLAPGPTRGPGPGPTAPAGRGPARRQHDRRDLNPQASGWRVRRDLDPHATGPHVRRAPRSSRVRAARSPRTWTHDARSRAFGGSDTISVLPAAGTNRNDLAAPVCSTVVGDAVARTTERATTAPARTAATTQPAPRLVSAFRAPSPRRRRSGPGIAGSVTGGVAPSAEAPAASASAGCSCSSTSAHLTVGTGGCSAAHHHRQWVSRCRGSCV